MKRNILKSIAIILISWIIAFISVMVVYMLPVEPMHIHAEESLHIFVEEGVSPTLIPDFKSTYLDTYTDMTMLDMAIYDGSESVLEKAMKGFRYEYKGMNIFESGIRYLQGEGGAESVSYARYWHGWMVFLKPLLLFFNYAEIRMLNFVLQTALTFLLFMKMLGDKYTQRYIIPFFISFMVIMPLSTSMSMGLAILYYVILISLLLFIHCFEWLNKNRCIFLFFMVVGLVTSFVDLVTYPLTTMGIMLIMWIILNHRYVKNYERKQLQYAFGYVISWCSGYLAMWLGKWLISSVITDENVLKDAILMVLYRASHGSAEGGSYIEIGIVDVISRNIEVICNPIYVILFISAILLAVCWKSRKEEEDYIVTKYEMGLLFIIGWFPIVWYIVIGNHSYVHYWMTYKSLSISTFAWGSLLLNCIQMVKKRGRVKK